MKKQSRLPLILIMVMASISGVLAQTARPEKSEPQTGTNGKERILENYLELTAATPDARGKVFSDLSSDAKAGVFRFQLAYQFAKRHDLTGEQRDLILQAISNIQADTYDRSKPESAAKAQQEAKLIELKAMNLFSKREVYEIFASMTASKADTDAIRRYLDIKALPGMDRRRELLAGLLPPTKVIIGGYISHIASQNISSSIPSSNA